MDHRTPDSGEGTLFSTQKGQLPSEVRVILAVLVGWGGVTFGFQFLVGLLGAPPSNHSFLTDVTFFGLPFHFWFTAQFLPLWFIVLCFFFNKYLDRLAARRSVRRDRDEW